MFTILDTRGLTRRLGIPRHLDSVHGVDDTLVTRGSRFRTLGVGVERDVEVGLIGQKYPKRKPTVTTTTATV